MRERLDCDSCVHMLECRPSSEFLRFCCRFTPRLFEHGSDQRSGVFRGRHLQQSWRGMCLLNKILCNTMQLLFGGSHIRSRMLRETAVYSWNHLQTRNLLCQIMSTSV